MQLSHASVPALAVELNFCSRWPPSDRSLKKCASAATHAPVKGVFLPKAQGPWDVSPRSAGNEDVMNNPSRGILGLRYGLSSRTPQSSKEQITRSGKHNKVLCIPMLADSPEAGLSRNFPALGSRPTIHMGEMTPEVSGCASRHPQGSAPAPKLRGCVGSPSLILL